MSSSWRTSTPRWPTEGFCPKSTSWMPDTSMPGRSTMPTAIITWNWSSRSRPPLSRGRRPPTSSTTPASPSTGTSARPCVRAGRPSVEWREGRSQAGTAVTRVRFAARHCGPCELRASCTNAKTGRNLTLRSKAEHDILRHARIAQETDDWRRRYKHRAGVEGTISQAVHAFGLRRSRYRGLAKTRLQHHLTGAAINFARLDAHLTGRPLARTRVSPFEALRPAG
ncbi:transposase [Streptomyces olivoverticillatus]|uniref:transposase n=1 Tax=Streptomyces olivoverticillatus TaxID=66427 RepID=UPI003CCC9054